MVLPVFENKYYLKDNESNYTLKVKSVSQISFIAWKIRKIGEASADTAATEAHYMKGYYNLEEETIKVCEQAVKETNSPFISKRIAYHCSIQHDVKGSLRTRSMCINVGYTL